MELLTGLIEGGESKKIKGEMISILPVFKFPGEVGVRRGVMKGVIRMCWERGNDSQWRKKVLLRDFMMLIKLPVMGNGLIGQIIGWGRGFVLDQRFVRR